MQATFDGLQIILVGDIQELPLLRAQTPSFTAVADDWSSDLKMRLVVQPEIKFFNLSNSQWEPLMEPWDLEADVSVAEFHLLHMFLYSLLSLPLDDEAQQEREDKHNARISKTSRNQSVIDLH